MTKDDPGQYQKAQNFVEKHQPVLVTQLSVLELVWVLMSRYGLDKERTCQVVEALLETAEMTMQAPSILESALMTWKKSKADFADCFILASISAVSENPLATFDTTLGKLEGRKQL